ncbi:MAG: hypothetical protein AAF950_18495 [Pseudomonadota bacterium]
MISLDPLSLIPKGLVLGIFLWVVLAFLVQPTVAQRLGETHHIPVCEEALAIKQGKLEAERTAAASFSPPPIPKPRPPVTAKDDEEDIDEKPSPPGSKTIMADSLRPYVETVRDKYPGLPFLPAVDQFLDTLEKMDAAEQALIDQKRKLEELKQKNLEEAAKQAREQANAAAASAALPRTSKPSTVTGTPSACSCAVTKAFGDIQGWMTLHVATVRYVEPPALKNLHKAIAENLPGCSHA